MGCTVRELLARIDARELAEWQAYASIEPFGEVRADLRAGVLASATVNSAAFRSGKAVHPNEFFATLKTSRRRPRQNIRKAVLAAQTWAAVLSGNAQTLLGARHG